MILTQIIIILVFVCKSFDFIPKFIWIRDGIYCNNGIQDVGIFYQNGINDSVVSRNTNKNPAYNYYQLNGNTFLWYSKYKSASIYQYGNDITQYNVNNQTYFYIALG